MHGHTKQIIGESINRCTDVASKRKQLLASLAESKMLPHDDEKARKAIKEMKEYMSRDQIGLVHRVREVKDPESVDMLQQFLGLLSGGNRGSANMMGLNQFLSFLNKDNGGDNNSPKAAPRNTTNLPRPSPSTAGKSISSRKPSISSQTFSVVSSRSTTPDTPRGRSAVDGASNGRLRDRGVVTARAIRGDQGPNSIEKNPTEKPTENPTENPTEIPYTKKKSKNG